MEIGGVDVRDAVAEHGSPLFLFDEADLRDRARRYRGSYVDAGARLVYYAAKAFLTTTIARWVTEEGLGIDVASGGELAVALRAGVPGERLLLHGNNKSMAEIEAAVAAGVGRIVIDSFEDVVRIADAAARAGVVQPVLVRVTVGVEAHTHEFIATAHEDQKFGLSVSSGAAEEAVRRIAKLPSLDFMGLHSHIGSQIFDAAGFQVAAARVVSLAQRIWDEQGIEIEELNLGGGMGIAYLESDDPLDVADMAFQIGDIVGKECAAAGIPMPALAFEPGRAIVGPAAVTVYEVGTVKPVELDRGAARAYVSVDGGMSDNIRTALYDAEYSVVLASRESTAEPGAQPRGGQALRVRRHRRARRVAARRPRARRPARRGRHRRLLPVDGVQLQLPAPARGGGRVRRCHVRDPPPGDARRPAAPRPRRLTSAKQQSCSCRRKPGSGATAAAGFACWALLALGAGDEGLGLLDGWCG